jgi:hypothetical protein
VKKFTPRYFIEKFAAIPDEQWTTGHYNFQGQHCALGHCNAHIMYNNPEAYELRLLFRGIGNVITINDGCRGFNLLGDTPRERILNALILVEAGVWKEII